MQSPTPPPTQVANMSDPPPSEIVVTTVATAERVETMEEVVPMEDEPTLAATDLMEIVEQDRLEDRLEVGLEDRLEVGLEVQPEESSVPVLEQTASSLQYIVEVEQSAAPTTTLVKDPILNEEPAPTIETPTTTTTQAEESGVLTPTASATAAAAAATVAMGESYNTSQQNNSKPLNVQDALVYLDDVKRQFQDQPDVYNRFLDVMKDFKTQTIDTPGVIERVSALFEGHPRLIQGFNAFLPPGFRIECDSLTGVIRVISPNGVTSNALLEFSAPSLPPPPPPPPPPVPPAFAVPMNTQYTSSGMSSVAAAAAAAEPSRSFLPTLEASTTVRPKPQTYRSPQASAPPPQPPPPPPAVNPLTATALSSSNGQEPTTEFQHAISFVNKIKARYHAEPHVYKEFLEILQQYQKDSKPLQEVYAEVQVLFRNAEELLAEFKQFLPDPASVASGDGNKSPSNAAIAGRRKRTSQDSLKVQQAKRGRVAAMSPTLAATMPASLNVTPVATEVLPPATPEELAFFEQAKRHIGNKQTYNEFLKILNLFSQEILSRKQLVERVEVFLGSNKELFDWFRRFVHADEPVVVKLQPTASDFRDRVDLEKCKKYGPSYRLLPPAEQNKRCSGRDNLCREVLNDRWVSHPTWESETSGFLAHRKNVYEEQMYRCEEERYEYDMTIQANLDTIALLELALKRPTALTPPACRRIIRKVYGDMADQVLEQLEQSPSTSIPVVIHRLRLKDEEWRRAQREHNRLWRELEYRNYYKALDRRGLTFKSNDKRMLNPRALITEIEALQRERPAEHHLSYMLPDPAVHLDLRRVLASWCHRQQSTDMRAVLGYVDGFLHRFFGSTGELQALEPALVLKRGGLFVNGALYVLFRLYQILYSRLLTIRKAVSRASVDSALRQPNPVAVDLALRNRPQVLADYDLEHGDLHAVFFSLLDRFFDQEEAVDANTFEECMRCLLGTDAYVTFTLDKLAQALAKQIHAVSADDVCTDLTRLFEEMSAAVSQGVRKRIAYRVSAEGIVGAEDRLYHVVYIPEDQSLRFQLLTRGEEENVDEEDLVSQEERWARYIENFVQLGPTESRAIRLFAPPFLKRNLPSYLPEELPVDAIAENGLEIKICVSTYRLFFVEGSGDLFARNPSTTAVKANYNNSRHRNTWRRWWRRRFDRLEGTVNGQVF